MNNDCGFPLLHMPRQHDRKPFHVHVELHFGSGNREAHISDISPGGCYIDTIVDVNVGDEVSFDLVHPNGGRLFFTAKVAFHKPGVGFGANFTEITEEQGLFLKRIIR